MSNWLLVLLNPACWVQNDDPFSPEWDAELKALIKAGVEPTENTGYEMKLGPYTIWIENHPYASFRCGKFRPSRATILRAGKIFSRPCPRFTPKPWPIQSVAPHSERP